MKPMMTTYPVTFVTNLVANGRLYSDPPKINGHWFAENCHFGDICPVEQIFSGNQCPLIFGGLSITGSAPGLQE